MLSERTQFVILGVVAVVVSLAGVLFAAFVSKDIDDGGRGGAIAVALALSTLFLTRNYASEVYQSLMHSWLDLKADILEVTTGRRPEERSIDEVEKKLQALEASLKMERQGQRLQNIWLSFATGFGTLFWGFGDILACWLM